MSACDLVHKLSYPGAPDCTWVHCRLSLKRDKAGLHALFNSGLYTPASVASLPGSRGELRVLFKFDPYTSSK